jgi:hypothetical protein
VGVWEDLKQWLHKAEFQHAVYVCGKRMRFQSQLGQTKVDFNNQGKNSPPMRCVLIRNFLIQNWNRMQQKIETACCNEPLKTTIAVTRCQYHQHFMNSFL